MISAEEKKLIWLQHYLTKLGIDWGEAAYIIGKLESLEIEYVEERREADSQSHVGEVYADN